MIASHGIDVNFGKENSIEEREENSFLVSHEKYLPVLSDMR